jgi:Tfp pilus assembly protein FimT
MLLVLVIAGVMMMTGFRSTRGAVNGTRLRSARVHASNSVAFARAAAIGRGCRAVFHIRSGSVGKMWITACRVSVVGDAGTVVDTLGRVDSLGTKYGITVASTVDSVSFDPRGITTTYSSATIRFTGATAAQKDSFVVNAVGRVVR